MKESATHAASDEQARARLRTLLEAPFLRNVGVVSRLLLCPVCQAWVGNEDGHRQWHLRQLS